MKKNKVLKPINVMTTSFLLASSLMMPTAGFAEESSTPEKGVANVQESEAKNQSTGTQTVEKESRSKATTARASNEAIVNNFAEMKAVLEADNGITTIKLGQNIDISGSINIQAKKSNILIDGNNKTVSETGSNGSSGGLYYGSGNILRNVTVKDLNIRGKNYYGFITINDASKNVEQVFENVTYSGPQMIWNRYGKAIFRGVNTININNTTMPGSSSAQEVAEVGSVEIEGDIKIFHNNDNAVIWSISKVPQFKIAPDAKVEINTMRSGYGIFYPSGGNGEFSIGKNAKVNFDGQKGITGKGILKSFIIESGAEAVMNRTGKDSAPMILVYGETEIKENAKLDVSTENGHAIQVVNVGTMNFKKPEKVILSTLKGQAIDNKSSSLTMNIDTGIVKLWTNQSQTPNSYVSKDGKDFTWNANYRNDGATSIGGSMNLGSPFNIEIGKTNKIELGTDVDGQLKRELAEAKKKVEDLFTNDKFDTLKESTNKAAVDEAQAAVNKLPAGPEKNRLQDLVNKANDLLKKKEQAEKDLNDAKNKVEDLFTNDKFDTLKESTNKAAVDEAQNAVSKLPAGPEKERLEELLNKAQDLLNKNEQAEKDLNDAKNKVEDLFTNDKFDTLKGSTDQGAIDEAKKAVDKLPEGAEKNRLDDLVNKAQDLLNKKIQAEKELNDAKNKVEDLFTNDKFDTLKGSTDQGAIDEAKKAVDKLPEGAEKNRLDDLVNKAQDLLNKKIQAEKELNDAKNKVENLFTNEKFDTLKGSTDQGAIDEAKEAVNKLPAGPEKERLEELLNKAQDLLNKNEQAEKDLNDAKNKVEDLFTDEKFDTLKGSTDQGAIDAAEEAVNKLPAGPEKERLEELLNNAQDLLNKNEQAEKELNDAKNKVEDLFTDDKFDTLKGSTDQGAIDAAEEAVNKLPAGPEKERLEELLNNAQDLLNKNEQAEKDLNDAKNKVEGLFTDDKFDTLKETADQGEIDAAQEAVNKLPEGAEKDHLQDLLNKAKDLLNKDVTAPDAPKLTEVTTNSKEVTGSGEPGANVTVTINTTNYKGVVGPDGKFKVVIPNQPVNTVISVTLTDAAGNVSKSSSVRVVQFMPSEPVKIDPVYPDAQTITGTAPEGATIVRLLVNGLALRTAPVLEDGTFSIYSKFVGVDENGNNIALKAGDIVTVDYGLRTPSNLQATITVVKEAVKLQVNPVAPNSDYVTGIAPEGTESLRLLVNGNAVRTISLTQTGAGIIKPDGSYSIYSRFVPDGNGGNRRLQAGDVIEVDYGPLIVGREVAKTIVQ
ncbi:toxin Cry1Ac domain D-VI-related protein [Peribacillus muralis]|uniref:toxin Cry1Ac domain D-VI-related protein n=1 Tax=Peribacillus muralis TaxID=264697 RepID=UPI003CFC3219